MNFIKKFVKSDKPRCANNFFIHFVLGLTLTMVGIVYTILIDYDKTDKPVKTDKNVKFVKFVKSENTKIEPKYYKKFYKILYKESGLETDPYNRKLDKNTVKKFCQIAKKNNIKIIDNIDKSLFDKLYLELCNQQIKEAIDNNII